MTPERPERVPTPAGVNVQVHVEFDRSSKMDTPAPEPLAEEWDADLPWIIGLIAIALLGAVAVSVFNLTPAPARPIEPSAAGGASGSTGGVLRFIGIPESGPGAELNAVVGAALELLLLLAGTIVGDLAVTASESGSRFARAATRLGFVLVWILAGALASVVAYLWLRLPGAGFIVTLMAVMALGLAERITRRPAPAGAVGRVRAHPKTASAGLCLLVGGLAALIWLAIFPGAFGASFRP